MIKDRLKIESMALKFDGKNLLVLDQTLLPFTEQWLDVDKPEDMVTIIQALKVRGAPLIGVAAALSLARAVETGITEAAFFTSAALLRAARPTAVNLMICIDRLTHVAREFGLQRVPQEAIAIFIEDSQLCQKIAEHGQSVIADGDGILTHCNTGGLATVGVGTALGVIGKAHELGKKIHVYVDETRPLLQGARLTTWECQKLGVPFTLICDNMAASLMAAERVQKVIVGADRIARNGDFANKVGTYSLAVLCQYHKIPFYVAAPYTTIDTACAQGSDIEIEQRKASEVTGKNAPLCNVWNPAFDVTPAELVTGWILDRGLINKF